MPIIGIISCFQEVRTNKCSTSFQIKCAATDWLQPPPLFSLVFLDFNRLKRLQIPDPLTSVMFR